MAAHLSFRLRVRDPGNNGPADFAGSLPLLSQEDSPAFGQFVLLPANDSQMKLSRKIIRLELAAPQKTALQPRQFSRSARTMFPNHHAGPDAPGSRAMAVCNSLMPPGRSPRKLFDPSQAFGAPPNPWNQAAPPPALPIQPRQNRARLDNAFARFTCACTNPA